MCVLIAFPIAHTCFCMCMACVWVAVNNFSLMYISPFANSCGQRMSSLQADHYEWADVIVYHWLIPVFALILSADTWKIIATYVLWATFSSSFDSHFSSFHNFLYLLFEVDTYANTNNLIFKVYLKHTIFSCCTVLLYFIDSRKISYPASIQIYCNWLQLLFKQFCYIFL